MTIPYKLIPLGGAAKKGEGEYRAAISPRNKLSRGGLGTEEVIKEACEAMHNLYPEEMVKMIFLGVLNSIRKNIMKDGQRRRIDGYFSARLDLLGKFYGSDAPADSSHNAEITFETLEAYRAVDPSVKFSNVVPRHRVYITRMGSTLEGEERLELPEGESAQDAIGFGRRILVIGEGICPVCKGDTLSWSWTDASGEVHSGECENLCDAESTIEPRKEECVYAGWPADLPEAAIGSKVRFTLSTHAGNPDAAPREVSHDVCLAVVKTA